MKQRFQNPNRYQQVAATLLLYNASAVLPKFVRIVHCHTIEMPSTIETTHQEFEKIDGI